MPLTSSPLVLPGTAFRRLLILLAVLGGILPAACGRGTDEPSVSAPAPGESAGAVVAVVNGIPLTEVDLRVGSASPAVDAVHGSPPPRAAVDDLVRDELARQQAVALGLDADPDYRRELAEMQARLAAFQRERLAEKYFRAEVARGAEVDESEAQRYYDENAQRIRTELHVQQILLRDESAIEQAAAELAAGRPFEEVAREQFPDLSAVERRPWDLGYLRWNQVPEAWRTVVDGLAPGGTSGVIRGPNRRFWIVQLVDRRENPELTFEAVREPLLAILRSERLVTGREDAERRLRDGAEVQYPNDP